MNAVLLRLAVELQPMSGIPDGSPTAPGDLGPRANEVIGVIKWIGIVSCVVAFIVAAAIWAFGDHHERGGGMAKLIRPCMSVALIAGSAGIIAFFA